jgi:hypothetical protein
MTTISTLNTGSITFSGRLSSNAYIQFLRGRIAASPPEVAKEFRILLKKAIGRRRYLKRYKTIGKAKVGN